MSHADEHAIVMDAGPYAELRTPRYVSHRVRPEGLQCDDHTRWLVLEESPSFYIVYGHGEGVSLKRKGDYEVCP